MANDIETGHKVITGNVCEACGDLDCNLCCLTCDRCGEIDCTDGEVCRPEIAAPPCGCAGAHVNTNGSDADIAF